MKEIIHIFFLAGVAGAATVTALMGAGGGLVLHDTGIEFPDGSVQTTAAASFGLEDAANRAVRFLCFDDVPVDGSKLIVECGPVPAGQIFVAESFSISARVLGDCSDAYASLVFLDDQTFDASHYVADVSLVTELDDPPVHLYRQSSPTHLYYTEGQKPGLMVDRICSDGYTGAFEARLIITGYSVDTTQP